MNVLGMVPHLPHPGPVVHVRPQNPNGQKTLPPPRESEDQAVALEAFRSIWTDIGFLTARDDLGPLRTLAVTSATRGEGKTFITCNLAAARAARGIRTLLVDADIRASGVARFFNLPVRHSGVSDILAGRTDTESAMQNIVVGERHLLHVLGAGSASSRPAELIESPAFDGLLATAADHDLVIIDTPPLNVLTDAASIAARVDAVIVVVRGEVTERDALRHTLDRLARANGRVIGIVLNDARLPSHYQSYSYADSSAIA
jgi:tyrosine-protein kinase Etk/Wzc